MRGKVAFEHSFTEEYYGGQHNFSLFVDDMMEMTEKMCEKMQQAVIHDTYTYIVGEVPSSVGGVEKGTPVDTGRAAASWDLTIGSPSSTMEPESPHKRFKKGSRLKYKPKSRKVRDAKNIIRSAKLDSSVYIINNLPYIERLEHGYSKKNRYFVAKAIARVKSENNLRKIRIPRYAKL